jgi:hypothetical protein
VKVAAKPLSFALYVNQSTILFALALLVLLLLLLPLSLLVLLPHGLLLLFLVQLVLAEADASTRLLDPKPDLRENRTYRKLMLQQLHL